MFIGKDHNEAKKDSARTRHSLSEYLLGWILTAKPEDEGFLLSSLKADFQASGLEIHDTQTHENFYTLQGSSTALSRF